MCGTASGSNQLPLTKIVGHERLFGIQYWRSHEPDRLPPELTRRGLDLTSIKNSGILRVSASIILRTDDGYEPNPMDPSRSLRPLYREPAADTGERSQSPPRFIGDFHDAVSTGPAEIAYLLPSYDNAGPPEDDQIRLLPQQHYDVSPDMMDFHDHSHTHTSSSSASTVEDPGPSIQTATRGRGRPRRFQIERRCKDRRNDSLNRVKDQLKVRGYPTERTDGTQANVMYKAADIMSSQQQDVQRLRGELNFMERRMRGTMTLPMIHEYDEMTGLHEDNAFHPDSLPSHSSHATG
ncbi:hypothetical protein SISNIDRAFT_468494 [Sistotremastrum niveocremeum HHB9708]|uniref:BHLH domain-containing protein n=1 Tax=Sistotremastrum niveocremeum HHB9708 TaxID=1314777 RepID=A0A164RBH3_9AGAM|nr:hypothetical protein SISNIDRAFT_468494 [Sistotremastrum niveocremeum HHB9708]